MELSDMTSNIIDINYFIIFLQNIDVANSLLAFI